MTVLERPQRNVVRLWSIPLEPSHVVENGVMQLRTVRHRHPFDNVKQPVDYVRTRLSSSLRLVQRSNAQTERQILLAPIVVFSIDCGYRGNK